jgi:hypothetical protein
MKPEQYRNEMREIDFDIDPRLPIEELAMPKPERCADYGQPFTFEEMLEYCNSMNWFRREPYLPGLRKKYCEYLKKEIKKLRLTQAAQRDKKGK